MAAQLLLINPKRKRRRAARRARSRRRRHVVRARRVHRRRRHVVGFRRRSRRTRRHIMRNPHHRRRRRVHRNPLMRAGGINAVIRNEVMPAALGALGAVGMDVIYGYISPKLGATLGSNVYLNAAVKGAGAVGLGMLAGRALGRERGRTVAVGALTVIAYELLSGLVKQMAPTLPMAGLGAYMPPMGTMGAYIPPGGVGAYNPAPYLQGLGHMGDPAAAMPHTTVMPYGYTGPTLSGLDGSGNLAGSDGMGMF